MREAVLIPGLGRSPGEGHGNPLQHSCLENPVDRGAWWATVHGVRRVGLDWAQTHSRVAEPDTIKATKRVCKHVPFIGPTVSILPH